MIMIKYGLYLRAPIFSPTFLHLIFNHPQDLEQILTLNYANTCAIGDVKFLIDFLSALSLNALDGLVMPLLRI